MKRVIIVMECHEDDDESIQAFDAYVEAHLEIMGQTLYNCHKLEEEDGA